MNNKTKHKQAKPEDIPIYRPPRGQGIHRSLFAFACQCAELGIDPEQCRVAIAGGLDSHRTHRDPNEREIVSAIECAYNRILGTGGDPTTPTGPSYSPDSGEGNKHKSDFPSFDESKAEAEFLNRGVTIGDLRRASPLDPPEEVAEVLRRLFAPEELVCLSRGPGFTEGMVKPRTVLDNSDPRILRLCSFVVPHPMTAYEGRTQQGKRSARSNNNTGPRRWIVCDFDAPPLEQQPSIIAALNEYWTPTLVVRTGGKGLHAWFYIGDASTEDVRTFEEIASVLGADPVLLGDDSRCQWVRMPNALRNRSKKQELIFWNPDGKEVEL